MYNSVFHWRCNFGGNLHSLLIYIFGPPTGELWGVAIIKLWKPSLTQPHACFSLFWHISGMEHDSRLFLSHKWQEPHFSAWALKVWSGFDLKLTPVYFGLRGLAPRWSHLNKVTSQSKEGITIKVCVKPTTAFHIQVCFILHHLYITSLSWDLEAEDMTDYPFKTMA